MCLKFNKIAQRKISKDVPIMAKYTYLAIYDEEVH